MSILWSLSVYDYCLDNEGMFASVALKSKKRKIPENISLYEASGSTFYFNDLKVSYIASI